MESLWIIIGLVAILVIFVWATYNSLVTTKVRVDQSLKDIDIQLKKRYDPLPDLVETARKASGLDEKIFIEVAKARSQAIQAQETGVPLAERAKVENQITSMVRDIKVAVEAYPDIRSHGELQSLMGSVTDIEDKIAYARQFYNGNVGDYNTKIKLFPSVLIAGNLGFSEALYFSAPEEEKKDVKVSFG